MEPQNGNRLGARRAKKRRTRTPSPLTLFTPRIKLRPQLCQASPFF